MKTYQFVIASLLSIILISCVGDKKSIDIDEMSDTSSFVNKNFKGNLINFDNNKSACEGVSKGDIASLYNVSEDLITIVDNTKTDRRDPNSGPVCSFYLESGESDFMWLRGSMSIIKEVGKDEYMGEIAEAAGNGENWKEAWALQKSISESSEWVSDLGKAAVWKGSNKILKIKFDGYTLFINPLSSALNKEEKALNRDYKKLAIEMAKLTGYVN
jgi:hypothetical protein